MTSDKAGAYIRLLIPALLLWSLSRMFILGSRLETARQELARVQTVAEEIRQENLRLEYEIIHADDPFLTELLARQRLGLVMPDEQVSYDSEDQGPQGPES